MKKLLLFVIACTLGLFGAVSAQETVLIGDEVNATTSTSNPFDIFYDYGISQQLYTADEINHAAGTISGIAIKFKGDESEPNGVYERKVAVYINSTDLETIPYGKAKNVQTGQVANFDGTITYVPENWATFNFTTPFQYDGGNILITMYDYTGKSAGEGVYSFYTNLNDDATDYKVSNKGDLPSNYNAYNIEDYVALGSVFSTTKERNIIQLTFGAAGEGGEEPEPTPEPEVPEQPETNDVVVTIGDASAENTNSSANYPFCNTYTYSHTQQIYSSAVIKSYSNNTILEGNITKIKYYIAEGSQEYFGGVKVYMRNSDLAAFTGATTTEAKQAWDKDFTAEDLVFEGEVDVVDNAIEMTLSKPFAYDGTKNLIIYVDVDTKNGTVATKFRYTKTFADGTAFTDKGLLYYRNQNNNAGLGNWTTASGSPSNYLSVVSLTFAGEGGGEEPTPEPEPTPVAPAAPVVAVDTVTETTVTLTWAAVENATSYNVYVGEATEAVNVKETTYTATGLTAETEYTFVVKAVNEVGESEASNVATAKTLAAAPVVPEPVAPAAPVVVVDTVTETTVTLTWAAVEGATSYNVYSADTLVENVTETTYTVEGLTAETEYTFVVKAVNEVGESEASNVATAKTLAAAPVVPEPDQPGDDLASEFSFDFEDGNLTGLRVFQGEGATGNNWQVTADGDTYYAGQGNSKGIYSVSWDENSYTQFYPNNYVVTEQAYQITENSVLSWFMRYTYLQWGEFDKYEVVASEDGTTFDMVLWEGDGTSPNNNTLSLAEYAGKALYLGFRHYAESDPGDALVLDNITLTSEEGGEEPTPEPEPEPEGPVTVTIGEGSYATTSAPIANQASYAYSYSQQIYLKEEIGKANGLITSIAFHNKLGGSNTRNIVVYANNTEKSSYATDGELTNLVTVSASDIVYEGEFTFGANETWSTIELQTPFVYTGENLVITVNDKTGVAKGYDGYDQFYATATTNQRCLYFGSYTEVEENMANKSYLSNLTVGGWGSSTPGIPDVQLTIAPLAAGVLVSTETIALGEVQLGEYWSEKEDVTASVSVTPIMTTITSITCDNDFFVLPTIDLTASPIEFEVAYNKNAAAGEYTGNLTITYGDGATKVVPMTATAYAPATPDVFELVQEITFTENAYTDTPVFANLHDDYNLPKEEGANAPDAVYAFELTKESVVAVEVTGTNANYAIYKAEDLAGNGPKADNNYVGEIVASDAPVSFFYDFSEENVIENNFTLLDKDGDGYNWRITEGYEMGLIDDKTLKSDSYKSATLYPDNYIVTKEKYEITANSVLSFKYYTSQYPDKFGIEVSTDGVNFTSVWSEKSSLASNYAEKVISLSDYAGQTVYIAIRHYESNGNEGYYVTIDDFKLESGLPNSFPAGKYYLVAAAEDAFTVNVAIEALEGEPEPVAPEAPQNVVATANGFNSIIVTWDAVDGAAKYVVYKDGEEFMSTSEYNPTTTVTIGGLEMGKEYCFAVKAVANGLESELSETVCQSTESLPENQVLVGEATTNYLTPFVTAVGNAWVEMIYKADEIGKAGEIAEIAYSWNSGDEVTADVNIYLAEVTKSEFANPNTTPESELKLVYSGTGITLCDSAWETFVLDTQFEYSGENNLLVVVATSNPSSTAYNYWNCYTGDANTVLIKDIPLTNKKPVMLLTLAEEVVPEPVVPAAPVVAVDTVTETTVTLTWAAVEGATSYNVYSADTLVANVKETTYTVEGLTAETEYTFVVKAVNEVGESEASNVATAKTLAAAPVEPEPVVPAAPVVAVDTVTETTVTLTWAAVEGATSYNVYSADTLVANVKETTYTVEGLTAETEYTFVVKAVNEVGESEASNVATAKTLAAAPVVPEPVVPAAPVVAVDTVTETTVTLTWAAVEGATSYNVYSADTLVANVKETTYTVEGLTAETEYTFVVKAVNEVGESEASNVATAKTLAAAPVGPTVPAAPVVTVTVSYDTIQVRWEPVAGATSYRLYYKGELQDEFEDPALDIQVPTQGKYCFTITAVNEVGESEPAEACADVVAPEGMVAPAAPVLNATLDGDVAVLSWSAVEFGTYYNVYLLTPQSEMPYQYLGTSKDTSVKLQLEDKGEYCFFVTAQNLVGESKESNTACVNYGEGVEENVATFNIYPNPVSDKLVIETEATIEAVTIYSLTGVMVYAEVDFNNNMIDVTDFASGVYFIKVRTENGEAVQRFIKK